MYTYFQIKDKKNIKIKYLLTMIYFFYNYIFTIDVSFWTAKIRRYFYPISELNI